jgi:hypothetical protein
VAPALRDTEGERGRGERLARRVRGLLNRLAESNLAAVVADVAQLYLEEGRRPVSEAFIAELVGVGWASTSNPPPLHTHTQVAQHREGTWMMGWCCLLLRSVYSNMSGCLATLLSLCLSVCLSACLPARPLKPACSACHACVRRPPRRGLGPRTSLQR